MTAPRRSGQEGHLSGVHLERHLGWNERSITGRFTDLLFAREPRFMDRAGAGHRAERERLPARVQRSSL